MRLSNIFVKNIFKILNWPYSCAGKILSFLEALDHKKILSMCFNIEDLTHAEIFETSHFEVRVPSKDSRTEQGPELFGKFRTRPDQDQKNIISSGTLIPQKDPFFDAESHKWHNTNFFGV